MPVIESRSADEVGVLHKALDVLECLADGEAWTVADLCRSTRISKPAAYRILNTLDRRGYVSSYERRRRYSLGPSLYAMSYALRDAEDLIPAARPAMRRLRDEFGETVNLGVLSRGRILYLDMLESGQGLRTAAAAGSFDSLHSTALGKAILSRLDADEARRLLERTERDRRTGRTIVEIGALMRDIAAARACGFAVDDEENEAGARCVAAVIPDAGDRPAGALSVSGPAWRMTDLAAVGRRVGEAALDVRRALLALRAERGRAAPPPADGSAMPATPVPEAADGL